MTTFSGDMGGHSLRPAKEQHRRGQRHSRDQAAGCALAAPLRVEILDHENMVHVRSVAQFSVRIKTLSQPICLAAGNSVMLAAERNTDRFRLVVNDVNVLRRSSFWGTRPVNRSYQSAKGAD